MRVDVDQDFCLLGLEGDRAILGVGPFTRRKNPVPDAPSFYVQDFYLSDEDPWLIPSQAHFISWLELKQIFPGAVESLQAAPTFLQPDFKAYAAVFDDFHRELQQGRLQKAVPVVFERASSNGEEIGHLVSRLGQLPGALQRYAFKLGSEFMVGASPELLLRREAESRVIFSEAVAGTTSVSESDKLLEDPHLGREHALVVEDISAQFSAFGRSFYSSTSFQPYPGLMHLRTEISLEPRSEISPEELLQALHPTAALGLYPRRPLSDPWMQKLDPMGCRRFYGAPFGVLLPGGHWRFVVLIRGLMFSSGELLIGSGSGVLASSSLAGEWSELEVKRRSVRRLFFK